MPLLQALEQPMDRAGRQAGGVTQFAEAKAGFGRRDAFQQIERAAQRLDRVGPFRVGTPDRPLWGRLP